VCGFDRGVVVHGGGDDRDEGVPIYIHIYTHTHIYIYIYRERESECVRDRETVVWLSMVVVMTATKGYLPGGVGCPAGFRIQGLGSGFRVQGSGFRMQSSKGYPDARRSADTLYASGFSTDPGSVRG